MKNFSQQNGEKKKPLGITRYRWILNPLKTKVNLQEYKYSASASQRRFM